MVKISSIRHQYKTESFIKKKWNKAKSKLKTAFMRGVLKTDGIIDLISSKAVAVFRFSSRAIIKRKIIKMEQHSYPSTLAEAGVFGANPKKVRHLIKEYEALNQVLNDLQEPGHLIQEKAEQTALMKNFLAALTSQGGEPNAQQYTTFLKLQRTLEQEVMQAKILLQKQVIAFGKQIKNISSATKQYNCLSKLRQLKKNLGQISQTASLYKLVDSEAYKTYQQLKYEMMTY